eukprot:SAG31_NODE_8893_length_1367_cov_1.455836_2_plen_245_part_01
MQSMMSKLRIRLHQAFVAFVRLLQMHDRQVCVANIVRCHCAYANHLCYSEYICRLLLDRGWQLWPTEDYMPPMQNPKPRQRPWGKRRVDFSNSSFYSNKWQIRVQAAEHLYDRLKLGDLSRGKFVPSRKPHSLCPPTYSINKGTGEKELRGLLMKLSEEDHGGKGGPWVWFLKSNLQNYGKGIFTIVLPIAQAQQELDDSTGDWLPNGRQDRTFDLESLLKGYNPAHAHVLQVRGPYAGQYDDA